MKSQKFWILVSSVLGLLLLILDHVVSQDYLNHKSAREEIQTRITRPFRRHPKPQIRVNSINVQSNLSTEIPVLDSIINLSKGLKRVELICSASQPIKWEFLVNEVSIPILDVQYRRIFHRLNSSEMDVTHLKMPALNSFEGRVILRGLLESQSGRYCCREFNGRFTNNSYERSANLSIFIPGDRIFTAISHTKYINSSENSLLVSCPVSTRTLQSNIALLKLKEDVFSETGNQMWEQVFVPFNPLLGFQLRRVTNFDQQLFGTYKCVVFQSQASIIVRVFDSGVKDEAMKNLLLEDKHSCWESPSCMKMVRSTRLECFCKDSYALFSNHHDKNGAEVNRKGNCTDVRAALEILSNATKNDWRIDEFLKNGEERPNVCFRDGIRDPLNGTGARVILRVIKMVGRSQNLPHEATSMANLTITFDGLPDWALGFQIGVEYKNASIPDSNSEKESNQRQRISFLNQEPTETQLFPSAHYRAIWRNVIVDTTEVNRIHVFQPDSFSFQWFHISSVVAHAVTNSTQVNPNVDEESCKENCDSYSQSKVWVCLALALGTFCILLAVVCAFIYLRKQTLVKYRIDNGILSPMSTNL